MNRNQLEALERESRRKDLPPFKPGDTLRVHVKIREGEKERIQVFEGVCIRRRGGGPSASFTVRKVSYGVGVERVFPVESRVVEKVEIKSRGHVRRARLYYLRELRGKAARLRSKLRDVSSLVSEQEEEARAIAAAPAATKAGEAVEEPEPEAPAEEAAAPEPAEEAPAEEASEEAKG